MGSRWSQTHNKNKFLKIQTMKIKEKSVIESTYNS